MTTISRAAAFRVAADVLDRSDWLATDLLADEGDENASENADRIVEILREEARVEGTVPATAPPPSVAAGAPTFATGGYVGPETAGWRPIGEAAEPDWLAALRRQEYRRRAVHVDSHGVAELPRGRR